MTRIADISRGAIDASREVQRMSASHDRGDRPRLLFLRFSRPDLPAFLRQHLAQQVGCLEHFFTVTVVESSIDYDETCDRVEPELVIFESGIFVGKRNIRNVHTHRDIPRLGFIHCDAFCPSRKTALADMARWGVDDFFTTSVALPHYTPELGGRIFVWPNFIDPHVYRDYGLEKSVPVLFTGSQAPHYPWRNAVYKTIAPNFTCMSTPHFGWLESASPHMSRMPLGERYARLINSALVAPTCGTIAKELVRKHLEIPACNTCLITEHSAALVDAGFEQGVNCVFADQNDILDRVAWLFREQDELRRISAAGQRLVSTRHVARQRSQVHDWFRLRRRLVDGQRIEQVNAFLPLTLVEGSYVSIASKTPREGSDRAIIRDGNRLLADREFAAAEAAFIRAGNYYPTAEASLHRARCKLFQGDANAALRLLRPEIARSFVNDSAMEPDPVEWSYLLVALLGAGLNREAADSARRFAHLTHPHLDHVRGLVRRVCGDSEPLPCVESGRVGRPTIHGPAPENLNALTEEVFTMLSACGLSVGDRLRSKATAMGMHAGIAEGRFAEAFALGRVLRAWSYDTGRRRRIYSFGIRVLKRSRGALRTATERSEAACLKMIGTTSVRLSTIARGRRRHTESDLVEAFASTVAVARVLSVGHSGNAWLARALVRGLKKNPHLLSATLVSFDANRKSMRPLEPRFVFAPLGTPADGKLAEVSRDRIASAIADATCELVAIDMTLPVDLVVEPSDIKAATVVLAGLATAAGSEWCAHFMRSPDYRMLHSNFAETHDYVIFDRIDSCEASMSLTPAYEYRTTLDAA